jgi:hypothetical protein
LEVLKPGGSETFALDRQSARELVQSAADKAISVGLPWNTTPVTLRPNAELVKAVKLSREKAKEG